MSDEHVQTGLVALKLNEVLAHPLSGVAQPAEQHAVNVPVAGSTPAPGATVPVNVPAANMPDGWNIQRVAKLVRDLSTNMYDLDYVLKTHALSKEQYTRLAATEAFQSALTTMTIEWNGIGNTQKRLALESAIYLEDSLPTVAARLNKATEPLEAVVALAKLLGTFAGLGGNGQTSAPSEKFKITFNLGADISAFDKARPVIQIETGVGQPLQQIGQTSGDTA